MKIAILTQEDSLTIPKNIEKIISLPFAKVIAIVNINSDSSLVNKKSLFLRGFGVKESIKMGAYIAFHKFIAVLDRMFVYKLNLPSRSLYAVSKKYKIPYFKTTDPNHKLFLNTLKGLEPDIIVSFSAPVIFRKELLELPRFSCINLHCSSLPEYAGIMPSFWVLYNNEKTTGCTVHYMDSKIDNGQILGQKKIDILPSDSMLDIIIKTK